MTIIEEGFRMLFIVNGSHIHWDIMFIMNRECESYRNCLL
jgi:hypothetical protein